MSNSNEVYFLSDRVVHHPTVAITITALEEIKLSRKAIAVCLVNDFTPETFTVDWLKNGEPLHSGIVTSPAFQVNGNGNFSATSQLTFPAADWFGGSVYTCQVTHEKELKSQNISRSPGKKYSRGVSRDISVNISAHGGRTSLAL